MNEERRRWQSRAGEEQGALSGVLFRGFSEPINTILHEWHVWCVRSVLLPRLSSSSCVLDLGCGYGRIAEAAVAARPDIRMIGQDFADAYCRRFIRNVGPSVLADIAQPPFADESFDAIIAVTSLMYLHDADEGNAMARIASLLKPGGFLLAIDPSSEVKQLVGAVLGRRANSPTSGRGFARSSYTRLFETNRMAVVQRGGNSMMSIPLLVPKVGRSSSRTLVRLVSSIARGDRRKGGYGRFALHRWVLAQRQA